MLDLKHTSVPIRKYNVRFLDIHIWYDSTGKRSKIINIVMLEIK
jgi:hypothetical protein